VRKLKICVIDLVAKAPTRTLYAWVMHANLASIMPQVVATWCEEDGHDVSFICYTGRENLRDELPDRVDLIFISAFSEAAQLAYALSNLFRSQGALTVLGGPHARCYPQDAQRYFDYVVGFAEKLTVREILEDCSPHRPLGRYVSAERQPTSLPGVRERWKFIELTLRKSPFVKIVPMIGSLGCPYTCDFCIDAAVPYQTMDFQVVKEDLQFLLTKMRRPRIGWHDPNFGVRFDEYMDAIEEAAPPDSIDFIAESSLSLLSEPRLKRLKRNGFKAILPGIESWYDLGNKSGTGSRSGLEKVNRISDHVNLILRYIPYVQANFVLGLDVDFGPEPFALTKRFLELTPGAFPAYSLLSAFGRAARLNLEYQRADRVLAFPHHFLNNYQVMNVKPKNYSWEEFYDLTIDLKRYSFSLPTIARRFRANVGAGAISQWMNVVRAISSEGFGRIKYHMEIRRRLDSDPEFLPYFNQETTKLPRFYVTRLRQELGHLWEWLPEGAIHHDPHAYLKAEDAFAPRPKSMASPMGRAEGG
jgi:hypothetical protein